MKCPECNQTGLGFEVEKRLNGDSTCGGCNYKGPSTEFQGRTPRPDMKCPSCGEVNPDETRTERRPNGDTTCGECGKKNPTAKWQAPEWTSVSPRPATLRSRH